MSMFRQFLVVSNPWYPVHHWVVEKGPVTCAKREFPSSHVNVFIFCKVWPF